MQMFRYIIPFLILIKPQETALTAVLYEEAEPLIYHYDAETKTHYEPAAQVSYSSRPTPAAYQTKRALMFKYEQSLMLGAALKLSEREERANALIMAAKDKEYREGLITPHLFKPSQHFFKVLDDIKRTQLFRMLQRMPKAGVLHAHDTALCSTEYVISLTYRAHLWVYKRLEGLNAISLRFARNAPSYKPEPNTTWLLLSELRAQYGNASVDAYLASRLTLYPRDKFIDVNAAWREFSGIFALLNGLLFYAPVWSDYYYEALTQYYRDGVQYLEFRSTLPELYDLDGKNGTALDTVALYKQTLARFMRDHPDFIGSKLIYAPQRGANSTLFEHYREVLLEAKSQYPDFIAGFDLVGQEEKGHTLADFVPELLALPDNIDFFFHAGETNWYGAAVDENLIDAVLLGSKRIGHGFSLVKHPAVLEMIKSAHIAIEVNPISNQVLQLVADYRNHPCAHLFANGYPVVISSDDPSFWKAAPLSHDYYIAFLGIASAHADLRLLKQLALNSIKYSSLSSAQKQLAYAKWRKKWLHFIDDLVVEGAASRSGKNITVPSPA